MIILVLSIPFATAIDITKANGRDEVYGFVKPNDLLVIQVEVDLPGDTVIDPTQLRVYVDDATSFRRFSNCIQIGNTTKWLCEYTQDLFGFTGSHDYNVKLYTDVTKNSPAATPVQEAVQKVYLDEIRPVVDSFTADYTSTSSSVRFDFKVIDKAIDSSEECSGINKIEIYDFDTGEVYYTTSPSGCEYEGYYNYEFSEGSKKICIRAEDNMGLVSELMCDTFDLDFSAPEIIEVESIKYNGKELTHIGRDPLDVEVNIKISGVDININKVYADFSKMSSSERIKTITTDPGEEFEKIFKWNVPINNFNECKVNVEVEDNVGNYVEKELSCGLSMDLEGPRVGSIYTDFVKEGVNYIPKEGAYIYAEIYDEGIGVNNGDVFLDLNEINGQVQKAESCNETCKWFVVPTKEGTFDIRVDPKSKDDLGNAFADIKEGVVTVDLTGPEILGSKKYVLQSGENYGEIIVTGSTIVYDYNVTDIDVDNIKANFSEIDGGIIDGLCNEVGDHYNCIFEYTVDTSASIEGKVYLNFIDKAGNLNVAEESVSVKGLIDVEEPNLWKVRDVDCSPEVIDRQVASSVPQEIYCKVSLRSKAKVQTATLDVGDMRECEGWEAGLIDVAILNNQAGSKDPVIKLTLDTYDFPNATYQVKCPLRIFSETNQGVTRNVEIDEVEMEYSFYNTPLGTMGSNIEDKYENVEATLNVLGDWVDDLSTVWKYSEEICKVRKTLGDVDSLIQILLGLFAPTIEALIDSGFGASAGKIMEETRGQVCGAKETMLDSLLGGSGDLKKIGKFLKAICKFVTCEYSEEIMDYYAGKIFGQDSFAQKYAFGEVGGVDSISYRDNIVYATITACVPGVLYNLQKWRQIECSYGTCLLRDIPEKGLDLKTCGDMYRWGMCNFVSGQIFSLLPFSNILDEAGDMIAEVRSNPFKLISAAIGVSCKGYCKTDSPANKWLFLPCSISKATSLALNAYTDSVSIIDEDSWDFTNQYCEEYEDAKEEYEKLKEGLYG